MADGAGARRRGQRRRWLPEDDLVAGFDREGERPGLRAFFATTIAASLFTWSIAFPLGAYHTVFYSRLFQILVVSTVLLLGSIALRRRVKLRPWTRPLLALPLLWLLNRFLAPLGRQSRPGHVLDGILIGLVVASVPFTMWALVRIMAPEYFALPARRLKTAAVLIVVVVAVAGFLVGQFNYRFTVCQQYVEAGDYQPPACHNGPRSDHPSPSSVSPAPSAS